MTMTAEELDVTNPAVLRAMLLGAGPAYFARYLDPKFEIPRHIDLLNDKLIQCATKPNKRVMVSVPPRHGKSFLISERNPVHFLELYHHRRIALVSNTDTLAENWGRNIRNIIASNKDKLSVRLSQDSQAANQWNTTQGGGLKSVGVGSNIIGFGFHMAVIDDPFGSQEDADSQTIRDKVWNWFTGTLYSRIEPGGSIIIVMARWNDDDLIGRILSRMKEGGEQWEYIEIPAIAKENDALNRKPGEPLWPERYSIDDLERIRLGVGHRIFDAQYQQEPTSATGPIFKRDWFRYYRDGGDHYVLTNPATNRTRRVLKSNCWRFISADTATTEKTTADYTVIQVWDVERTDEGGQQCMFLVEQWRAQARTPDVKRQLRQMHQRYKPLFIGIEDKITGTAIIQDFSNEGLPIRAFKAKEDKRSRAATLEVWMENSKVWFPESAPWLDDLEKELLVFTGHKDKHDDQVDVAAHAAIYAKANDSWRSASAQELPANSIGKLLGMDKVFGPKPPGPNWYARRIA